jgi:hypothetical protein
VLIIIHWASDLPQGHLQDSVSLRIGGVLVGVCWMPPIEWGMWGENCRLRVGMRSVEHGEVRGVEAPEASRPDFTGVTVP